MSQFVNNQTRRKNKKLLGDLFDFPDGTMPIGRLDEKSEGLLLLTTDGKVSETVRSRQVEKEYYVQVDGSITPRAITQLSEGVEITLPNGKYTTLPCHTRQLKGTPETTLASPLRRSERHGPTSWLAITLTEGKFRQVRKMTAAAGFPTLRLIRIRIGHILLDNLSAGEVVETGTFNLCHNNSPGVNG